MKYQRKYTLILALALLFVMESCQQPGGNSPGSEYMPDMSHSIAYEANYYNYYYNNTWGTREEYYKYAQPRLPVKGTVSRKSSSTIAVPTAGENTPYYYGDTDEERVRATNELVNNPMPITDSGLAIGKELYNINCGICHGDKGDGNGYLVRDDGGVYPVQPANLINDEFTAASNGRFYHSIMYGKNLMGSYKDKLNYTERWQVIHYVRSLQAKERKLKYDQMNNTLNSIDRPAGNMQIAALGTTDNDAQHTGHDATISGHHDASHSHDDKEQGDHDHQGGHDSHDDHDDHNDDHNHNDQ